MLREAVRRGIVVDLKHGRARHRDSLNASREARNADIVWSRRAAAAASLKVGVLHEYEDH